MARKKSSIIVKTKPTRKSLKSSLMEGVEIGKTYDHSGGEAKVLDIYEDNGVKMVKYKYRNKDINGVIETQSLNGFLISTYPMKSGGTVSPSKARRILHEGEAHGQPLTEQQRKFFGARASGYPVRRKEEGGTTSNFSVEEKKENDNLTYEMNLGTVNVGNNHTESHFLKALSEREDAYEISEAIGNMMADATLIITYKDKFGGKWERDWAVDEFPRNKLHQMSSGGSMEKGGKTGNNIYYLIVDMDERGEYAATVYNEQDQPIWEVDTQTVRELQEDGYLKYKPNEDLGRLTKYLIDMKIIPSGSDVLREIDFQRIKEREEMASGGFVGSVSKIWDKTKELGKKGYEKGAQFTKETIRNQKESIAVDVLNDYSKKSDLNKSEKETVKDAKTIIVKEAAQRHQFVNNSKVDLAGTHRQGVINVSYAAIEKVFGKPTFKTSDEEEDSKFEWNIKFEDGLVAHIYDYKMEHDSDWIKKNNKRWNVGAKNKDALQRVADMLGVEPDVTAECGGIMASGGIAMARGGGIPKAKYKKGEIVKVASDNDNEGYDSFRNRPLRIIHVATSQATNPGYDSGMEGMGLYDFVDAETGEEINNSLYDYELEYYKEGGKLSSGGTIQKVKVKTPKGEIYTTVKQDKGSEIVTDEGVFKKSDVIRKIEVDSEHFMKEGGKTSKKSKSEIQNQIQTLEKALNSPVVSEDLRESLNKNLSKLKGDILIIETEEKKKKILSQSSSSRPIYIDIDNDMKKKMRAAIQAEGIPYRSKTEKGQYRVYVSNKEQQERIIAIYNEKRSKFGRESVEADKISGVFKTRSGKSGKIVIPKNRRNFKAKSKLSKGRSGKYKVVKTRKSINLD